MGPKIKYPFKIYFWMVPCPINGKVRKTRYRMSELDAMRYPGAVKIEADSILVERPLEVTPNNF